VKRERNFLFLRFLGFVFLMMNDVMGLWRMDFGVSRGVVVLVSVWNFKSCVGKEGRKENFQ